MADYQLSTRTVIWASLAGLVIGGPLLAMAGFSFLASVTLLLVSSPLLLIFSPVLLGAGAILVAAMAGFGTAAAAGLGGLSSFGWVSMELGVGRLLQDGLHGGRDTAESVKEEWKDFGEYLLQGEPRRREA